MAEAPERNDTFAFGEKDGATEAHGDAAHAAIADFAAQEDLATSVGDRTFEESRHELGCDPAPLPTPVRRKTRLPRG